MFAPCFRLIVLFGIAGEQRIEVVLRSYREQPTMRPTIAALVLAAAFVGAPQTASAQSPYSYQWCAKYFTRGTPTSCYYATQQLCMATVSGIGGNCFPNPGYTGAAVAPRHYQYGQVAASPRHYRYARVAASPRHYRYRRA